MVYVVHMCNILTNVHTYIELFTNKGVYVTLDVAEHLDSHVLPWAVGLNEQNPAPAVPLAWSMSLENFDLNIHNIIQLLGTWCSCSFLSLSPLSLLFSLHLSLSLSLSLFPPLPFLIIGRILVRTVRVTL